MPFPDSTYPSVLRGYDKRQSERLAAAAPDLLAACRRLLYQGMDRFPCYCNDKWVCDQPPCDNCVAAAALAKAEGQ